jgi:hypothetical protein
MKFLDKYELVEQVTAGAVATFIGRQLSSGERVLVHIFSGSDQMGSQTPLEWATQSFRSLAPAPMGTVIEGGRYLQAPGAFLVTKFPDMNTLSAWVRLYNSQSEATAGIVSPPPDAPPLPPPKPQASPLQVSSPPSTNEFSRAFKSVPQGGRESSAPLPPTTPTTPTEATGAWSRRVAGPFTKEFLASFEEGAEGKKPAAQVSSVSPQMPVASSFTAQFLMARVESGGPQRPIPNTTTPPARPNPGADKLLHTDPGFPAMHAEGVPNSGVPFDETPAKPAGEFTKFFSGPFDRLAPPAAVPTNQQNHPAEPVVQDKSEFHRIFGTSAGQQKRALDPGPLLESPQPRRSGDDIFDSLFDHPEPPGSRPLPPSVATPTDSTRSEMASPPRGESHPARLGAGLSPLDNTATVHSANAPSQSGRNEATRLFTPPDAPAAPPLQDVPAGPSDFTRVISRRPANPAAPEPARYQVSSPEFRAPQLSVPMVSSLPSVPSMPVAPAPMSMPSPQMPSLQQPSMPALPQVPVPDPQPAVQPPAQKSYWPLVIAMNVLLLAAIALVMYFALKK